MGHLFGKGDMDPPWLPGTWNIFINFTKQLKQSTLLRLKNFQWFVFGKALGHQYIRKSLLQPGTISFKHIILEDKYQESG